MLLRKLSCEKVSGLVADQLDAKNNKPFSISTRRQLNLVMPPNNISHLQPKRFKALDTVTDILNGQLDDIPTMHPAVALIVDGLLAKTVIGKTVYRKAKWSSALEVAYVHKVVRHAATYRNTLCVDFLGGSFDLPTDIHTVAVKHIQRNTPLTPATQDGINDVLRMTHASSGWSWTP